MTRKHVVDDTLACDFELVDPRETLGELIDIMCLRLAHDKSSEKGSYLQLAQKELETVANTSFDVAFRVASAATLKKYQSIAANIDKRRN